MKLQGIARARATEVGRDVDGFSKTRYPATELALATTGTVMLGIDIASGQRVKRLITVEQYLLP